jgi:hypothetical protein
VLDARVARRTAVEVVEEPFARTQEHGHDGHVHLVEEARRKEFLQRGRAATDAHVESACRSERLLARFRDALGEEVERGATLHLHR